METEPAAEQSKTFDSTDKLDRQQCARILTKLLSNETGPLVLAIDSPWGTGKTTFLDMWTHELKTQTPPFPVIRINTWETDYTDQPFASLIVSIRKYAKEFNIAQTGVVERACEQFSKAACNVLRHAPKLALEHFAPTLVPIIEAAKSEGPCEEIEQYEAFEKELAQFRKELETFVHEISASYGNKPVLLMVDELDRCRPTYAIEFLEVVKHLFAVKKLVFVLTLNKAEIAASMKAIYGETSDTTGYLRRFFDIEYRLPLYDIKPYCEHVLERYKLVAILSNRADYGTDVALREILVKLSTYYGIDLRTIEFIIRRLSLILKLTPNADIVAAFIMLILFVKEMDKEQYLEIISGKTKIAAVFNAIKPGQATQAEKLLNNTIQQLSPKLRQLMEGYFALFDDPEHFHEIARQQHEGYRVAGLHAQASFPNNRFKEAVVHAIEMTRDLS